MMHLLTHRLVCAASIVLVLVVSSAPVPAGDVPLQAPIFRSWRLDFAPTLPASSPSQANAVLPIQYAQAGDFDGDGSPDLLMFSDPCTSLQPGLFLLHPTEAGTIGSISGSPDTHLPCFSSYVPAWVRFFTPGDFDGDGIEDFASWYSGKLFLQRPGQSPEVRPLNLPLDPPDGTPDQRYFISGDLNRDGVPDVVAVQEYFSGSYPLYYDATDLYVFLADGQGGFARSQKISAASNPVHPLHLLPFFLTDFTGDGVPDYLGYDDGPGGGWEILPGDGAGHLLPPDSGIAVPSLPQRSLFELDSLAAGDVNADGLADLLLGFNPRSGQNVTPALFLSAGVGEFQQAQVSPLPAGVPTSHGFGSSSMQDVDGDGHTDLVLFIDRFAVIYPGGGPGVLGAPRATPLPFRGQGVIRMKWDEDSREDLVFYGAPAGPTPDSDRSLSVFLGQSAAAPDQVEITPPWPKGSPAAVGDFDGDGEKDLLFAGLGGTSAGGRIVVYRGNGRGGFTPLQDATPPPAGMIVGAAVADFNHDGRDDAAVLSQPATAGGYGSVTVYLGRPPGEPPSLFQTRSTRSNPIKILAADLNGDGNPDVLVADKGILGGGGCPGYCGGTVSAYLGRDDDSLDDPILAVGSNPPGGYWGIGDIQVGLVNPDSTPDLVVLFSTLIGLGVNYATWARGLGDGSFASPELVQTTATSTIYPLMAPADVNGDGLSDLALYPLQLLAVQGWVDFSAYLGNPSEDLQRFSLPASWNAVSSRWTDLDADGFLDLAGNRQGADFLKFGSSMGTGALLQRGPFYSPSGLALAKPSTGRATIFSPPLFGDFDDDHREDLVTWDDSSVHVLLNRSNRVASDPAESLLEASSGRPAVAPGIDLAEIQARVGSYDFSGRGIPQGALVFTLSLNDPTETTPGVASGDVTAIRDGSARAGGGLRPGGGRPGPAPLRGRSTDHPHMKAGTFQLFLNFGEALKDTDGDGMLDLSLANALQEPGLAGFPLADVTLSLRPDGGGPPFTGLHDIGRFSTVDRERGIATFVVPFEDLLAALTPAERSALDQGDGTGRLFLWAVSRLYGDRDRVPDTDDGGDPTIRSEVREFRFPLRDPGITPLLTFGQVRIGESLTGPMTLVNHGAEPIGVSAVELPDPAFGLSPLPPFVLPPAGRVQMDLRYTPTEHGGTGNPLVFHLEDPGEPTLEMQPYAAGVAPVAEVSPESLDFGSGPVGLVVPAAQTIRIHNAGDATLNASWALLDPAAEFSYRPEGYYYPPPEYRSLTLAPDQTITYTLYLIPTELGSSEATFRLETDDPLRPQIDVKLLGTGTAPEPRIFIESWPSPGWITGVPLGGEGSETHLVRNRGSAPLHILSVTSSLPLFTTGVDPTTIPPGETGTLTVTYHPTEYGEFTSQITILSDDPTQPTLTGGLYGKAYEPPPQGQISQTILDFGDVSQGETVTRSFDITDTGGGRLYLSGYSSPPLSTSCAYQTDLPLPHYVLPGEVLTVHVTLTADIDKTLCGSFSFDTNDPILSWVRITLKSHILSPLVVISPTDISFSSTAVGSSSTMTLGIGNNGQDALRITQTVFGRAEFGLGGDLPAPVPVGGLATLPIVFAPGAAGTFTSYVDLYTNDTAHRKVRITLTGTAVPPGPPAARIGIKE